MSSIRFGKFFGFILVAFFVWLFDKSFCRFSSISSYHTKSLVFTPVLLTLETYVKYWEKYLCLHSNQINSSAKCQEDEMNVSENCNCYFSGIFHHLNEWGRWIFKFIFSLPRLVIIIDFFFKAAVNANRWSMHFAGHTSMTEAKNKKNHYLLTGDLEIQLTWIFIIDN